MSPCAISGNGGTNSNVEYSGIPLLTGLAIVCSRVGLESSKSIGRSRIRPWPRIVTVASIRRSPRRRLLRKHSLMEAATSLEPHFQQRDLHGANTQPGFREGHACKPEGCGHKDYTAVVYVVSGAATLVVGGTAKSAAPDKEFGGQSIQGGESHRIAKGDVFIMPPDTVHWYKNVEAPFRYLEVPVP